MTGMLFLSSGPEGGSQSYSGLKLLTWLIAGAKTSGTSDGPVL